MNTVVDNILMIHALLFHNNDNVIVHVYLIYVLLIEEIVDELFYQMMLHSLVVYDFLHKNLRNFDIKLNEEYKLLLLFHSYFLTKLMFQVLNVVEDLLILIDDLMLTY